LKLTPFKLNKFCKIFCCLVEDIIEDSNEVNPDDPEQIMPKQSNIGDISNIMIVCVVYVTKICVGRLYSMLFLVYKYRCLNLFGV